MFDCIYILYFQSQFSKSQAYFFYIIFIDIVQGNLEVIENGIFSFATLIQV